MVICVTYGFGLILKSAYRTCHIIPFLRISLSLSISPNHSYTIFFYISSTIHNSIQYLFAYACIKGFLYHWLIDSLRITAHRAVHTRKVQWMLLCNLCICASQPQTQKTENTHMSRGLCPHLCLCLLMCEWKILCILRNLFVYPYLFLSPLLCIDSLTFTAQSNNLYIQKHNQFCAAVSQLQNECQRT